MSLWTILRQTDRIAALERALQEKISHERSMEAAMNDCERRYEIELTRRISAEAISGERRAEVERLVLELSDSRDQFKALMSERLRSLDALNLKLMEPRAEEKPPDMAQFRRSEDTAAGAVRSMQNLRKMSADMDMALLTQLHPAFKRSAKPPAPTAPSGVSINEPMTPEVA